MIALVFAWLAHNWIWLTLGIAATCCGIGGYLTWRDWTAQEASGG